MQKDLEGCLNGHVCKYTRPDILSLWPCVSIPGSFAEQLISVYDGNRVRKSHVTTFMNDF